MALGPLCAVFACGASAESVKPSGTDCHMHVSPDAEAVPRDAGRVLSVLEGAGLSRACILSQGYSRPDGCGSADCPAQRDWTIRRNDWTLEQARGRRGLIAFCGVPLGVSWAKSEVLRCAENGARGLKIHPVNQGLSLAQPETLASLREVGSAAGAAGLPILIHIPFEDSDIRAFYELAAGLPKTTFILAHQLGPKMAMLPKATPNVYADISGLVLAPRAAAPAFVKLWRAFGMQRVLLGSDWPLLRPSEHIAALRAFPLSEEERRMIIAENARRLFPESTPEVLGGCQGEGCDCYFGYRDPARRAEELSAVRAFVLREERSENSKALGRFEPGTMGLPLGQSIVVLDKGAYRVIKAGKNAAGLTAGDRLDTLLSEGEGFYRARRRGKWVDFGEEVELRTLRGTRTSEWSRLSVGGLAGYAEGSPFQGCLE